MSANENVQKIRSGLESERESLMGIQLANIHMISFIKSCRPTFTQEVKCIREQRNWY